MGKGFGEGIVGGTDIFLREMGWVRGRFKLREVYHFLLKGPRCFFGFEGGFSLEEGGVD